jgi:Mg2+/citrate symporter
MTPGACLPGRLPGLCQIGKEEEMFKLVVVLLVVAFAAGMGVIVATRLSVDALAVIVGIVCGVGASIPISLLLALVMGRQERRRSEEQHQHQNYPPVMIIGPGHQAPRHLSPKPDWRDAPVTYEEEHRYW